MRAWHRLDWDTELSSAEKEIWTNVGITREIFLDGQGDGTWQAFTRTVLLAADTWQTLDQNNQTAEVARVLHYTEDTWGRAWTFLERIFYNDVSGLPSWNDDLTDAEQAALESLGFTADTWSSSDAAASNPIFKQDAESETLLITRWGGLTEDQKGNATHALRITEWHWERVASATQEAMVEGCFWDQAKGEAVAAVRQAGPAIRDPGAPRRPTRRQRRAAEDGDAEPVVAACSAGFQPSEANALACTPCPADTYKSSSMVDASACVAKTLACDGGARLFSGLSTVLNDNLCVLAGQCPPGEEPAATTTLCAACTAGNFKQGVSASMCAPKTSSRAGCTAGKYFVAGGSAVEDDNLCVACPHGTFAIADAQLSCASKAVLANCPEGHYFTLGTSSTANDSKCTPCPAGSWKSGTAAAPQCSRKMHSGCPAGQYLVPGSSSTFDDSHCIVCPPGTFSPSLSAAETCVSKSPGVCRKGETLFSGSSANIDDNVCVAPGLCPPGHHVSAGSNYNGLIGCAACPAGTFSALLSRDANCANKSVAECPEGNYKAAGSSGIADDSRCIMCSRGTFKTAAHPTSTHCFLKSTLQTPCPAGFHVSNGVSTIEDDHACQECALGTYQPTNASTKVQCKVKMLPRNGCAPGMFLQNTDSKLNNYECEACPEGTFNARKTVGLSSAGCTRKTEIADCTAPEILIPSNTTAADNICATAVRCGAGERVDYAGSRCMSCPKGQFNSGPTTRKRCLEKQVPALGYCKQGTRFVRGNDPTIDDWRCIGCPPGSYSNLKVANFSTTTTCARKEAPATCPPGQATHQGNSAVEDDWFCSVRSRHAALCTKSRQFDSRSMVEALAMGLPERVVPFIKEYRVTMRTRGHPPSVQTERVVVTGPRFVSAAEKLPFPEGRPLVTLHDPPGGGSFSAFTNARTTISTSEMATSREKRDRVKIEADGIPLPGTPYGATIGIAGVINSPRFLPGPDELVDFEVSLSAQQALVENEVADSSNNEVGNQLFKTEFEFTYKTSPLPDRPGPASDAFLMPALTFDVIEVWVVHFLEAESGCRIRGLAEKSLEPRDDLSGFYFITANDVETRTLPTLAEVSAGVLRRLQCDRGYTECCTEGDKAMGCNAKTLATYCAWKHGTGTESEARCVSISDDHWKTQCQRAAAAAAAQPDDKHWSPCATLEDVPNPSGVMSFLNQLSSLKQNALNVLLGTLGMSGSTLSEKLLGLLLRADQRDLVVLAGKKLNLDTSEIERIIPGGPQCSEGFQKEGSLYECEMEQFTVLAKPGGIDANVDGLVLGKNLWQMAWNADKLVKQTQSALPTFVKEAQTYKTRCVRVKSRSRPALPECSRKDQDIKASDVDDYCSKRFPSDAAREKECIAFVESDVYSKAHDNWYNTLGRNYAKQEKANVGAGATVYYDVLDTLNAGTTPVRTSEEVSMAPMGGLAPSVLIENAMDHAGNQQTPEKRESFGKYNTLSFEGGGSSMVYTWRASGKALSNGNDFGGYSEYEQLTDTSAKESLENLGIRIDWDVKAFNKHIAYDGSIDMGYEETFAQINVATTFDSASDDSHSLFELADPDAGDYFVVTCWEDPEYLTPIFSLQGGASSCAWEQNTYHRAAPSMLVDYVGPESLPPYEAAIFKITLQNAVFYYEVGPSAGKERPGWATADKGYSLPTVVLAAVPQSIKNGLRVSANGRSIAQGNGIIFPEFGKGSAEVLVEVRAGPPSHAGASAAGWLEYQAPVLTFRVECSRVGMTHSQGEQAVDASLGTAGAAGDRIVRFIRACPQIEWSGQTLASSTFHVAASPDNAAVPVTVSNPSGESWVAAPRFEALELQYRFLNSAKQAGAWLDAKGVFPDKDALEPGNGFASGSWTPPPSAPDGVYDIRARAVCGSASGATLFDEFRESSTPVIIRGIVDRHAPAVMCATSSSGTQAFARGDAITVSFNEDVVCTTFNTFSETALHASFAIVIPGVASFEGDQLLFACRDSDVKLSLSSLGASQFDATVLNADTDTATVEVRVEGVMDAAGNQGGATTVVIRGGFVGGNDANYGNRVPTTPDLQLANLNQAVLDAEAVLAEAQAQSKVDAAAITRLTTELLEAQAAAEKNPGLANLNQAVLDADAALADAQAQTDIDENTITRLTAELIKAQGAAKKYVTVPSQTSATAPSGDHGGNNESGGSLASSAEENNSDRATQTTHASFIVSSIIIIAIVVAVFVYQHRIIMAKLDAIQIEKDRSAVHPEGKAKKKKKKKTPTTKAKVTLSGSGAHSRTVAVAINPAYDPGTDNDNVVSKEALDLGGRDSAVENPTYDGLAGGSDSGDFSDDLTI